MSTQANAPVDKTILPFNPPGTFAPGTFAPGSSAQGVVAVLAPSYPLKPSPDMGGGDLYPQAAFPPQAVVAHPRSASIPLMGDPTPQTYSITTYYTGDGVPVHSRASVVPVDVQHNVMAVPQQAITTEPRYPMMAGGSPSPTGPQFDNGALSQRVNGHARSPAWPTTNSPPATQTNIPMQATRPMSYLQPQAGVAPESVPPPPPYQDEKVPPLTTQPRFNWQGDANIISNDDLLNKDGDALYRFILDHMDLPTLQLHCYGSHIVTSITASSGKVQTKETTVVDFDFVIDLALSMNRGSGEPYVLDDNVFAYRGRMEKEVGSADAPRTVRDWARNYAESPKTGKEFRFRKTISGLDRPKVIDAINQIINSTGHSTYRNVYFTTGNSNITIRANSDLMTMLTNGCLGFLLWIVCAYPFVWMYRRFGEAGGKWDVCRASYACVRDPRDPVGVANGVPLGDGDWVKIWERTIRLGVGNRIQTSRPIFRPTANDSGVIVFD